MPASMSCLIGKRTTRSRHSRPSRPARPLSSRGARPLAAARRPSARACGLPEKQRFPHAAQTASEARAFFEAHFLALRNFSDTAPSSARETVLHRIFRARDRRFSGAGREVPSPPSGAPLRSRDPSPGRAARRLRPSPHERPTNGRRLLPFPDRAAIEAGALAGQGLELVWLEDRVEVFIIQVQGSAQVTLTDGRRMRLRYAGRNGWPYTSIGRLLIEEGAIAADEMSLETLTAWLRANPGKPGRSCGATALTSSSRSRRLREKTKVRSGVQASL